MKEYNLIIVGGGAAGILCAIEANKQGMDNILLIEKDPVLGGALNLGNYNISRENTINGQEYKKSLMKCFDECKVDVKLNTMVLKIHMLYILKVFKNIVKNNRYFINTWTLMESVPALNGRRAGNQNCKGGIYL